MSKSVAFGEDIYKKAAAKISSSNRKCILKCWNQYSFIIISSSHKLTILQLMFSLVTTYKNNVILWEKKNLNELFAPPKSMWGMWGIIAFLCEGS